VLAANWIESLGRADDHAELLAYHYASALKFFRAVGTDTEHVHARARVAFRSAAQRAFRLGNYSAAARFFDGALGFWPDDEERLVVAFERGHALVLLGNRDPLRELIPSLEQAGERELAAEALVLLAQADWHAGAWDAATALTEKARAMLAGRAPSRALAAVLSESARRAVFNGRVGEGIRAAEEAAALADELGLDELGWDARATRATAEIYDGRLGNAVALLRNLLDEVPQLSWVYTRAATNLSVAYESDGFMGAAYQWQDRVLDATRRSGDRPRLLWIESFKIRGPLYVEGRWDEALERSAAFFESVGDTGHGRAAAVHGVCACIYASRNDGERAAKEVEAALPRVAIEDLKFFV
jgi:tetratricopeptide (TPR) repeat protein